MRRWRILTLLLAALGACGLLAPGLFVSAAGRDVRYDETILQGEAGDFSGVVVHAKIRMGNEVLWQTEYRPGGEAESTVKYGVSDWEPMDEQPSVRADSFLTNAPAHRNGGEADAMVEDVALRTQENETREEVVRAADWYESFPLQLDLESVFNHELKIPVPENFFVHVTVSREVGAGYSFTVTPEDSTSPTLSAVSAGLVRGEDAHCWFALDAGHLDTSLLPGGGGVMQMDTADGAVKHAHPLPAGTRVVDLWLSEDESTLYVLHSLDGAHTLTALSTDDMAVRQEIALPIAAEAALEPPIRDGNTTLIPATDGTMTVLTAGDDDLLTLRTQVNIAGDPVMQDTEAISADWADGRLVVARQQYIEEDIMQDLDLLLSIYDENGSRSTMASRCSVGREITPERDKRTFYTVWDFPLRPGWTRPVTIQFEP